MKVVTDTVVATHDIDGRPHEVHRLVWTDGGLSYDVYAGEDKDDCLTMDESFDAEPTVEQIRALSLIHYGGCALTGCDALYYATFKDGSTKLDLCQGHYDQLR